MTSGCSGTAPVTLAPIAVDTAPLRCPDVDQRTRSEFGRLTPPPAGNLTREHVDKLDESQIRKNLAGRRLIAEYEKCRGVPSAPPATAKVS